MQINCDKTDGLDESIIQTIVNKLGYTADDVRKFVKEENSFVSVLYHKLIEEQGARGGYSKSTAGSVSAKTGI